MLGYNFTENFTVDVAMEISKMSETIYTAAALGKFIIKVVYHFQVLLVFRKNPRK